MAEGVWLAVGPDGLAALGVNRHHVTTVACDGVEHAINITGGCATTAGLETSTVPNPRCAQGFEIAGIDLGCRNKTGMCVI